MVRIERISRNVPKPEIDPTGKRFQLIEVYVQEPTTKPDDTLKVSARPYEFEDELPSKYATTCPQCGQGIWFERCDIHTTVDKFFITCPECNQGFTTPIPPMVDPFVNPVSEKISETVLDPDLSKAQDPIEPGQRTVQEKLASAGVETNGHSPDENELDEIEIPDRDKSEIEQLLEELERNE